MSNAIMISGATGFIGRHLTARFVEEGQQAIALSRRPEKYRSYFPEKVEFLHWDKLHSRSWSPPTNITAIINLAGENIAGGIWTRKRKQKLVDSRLQPTRTLVNAVHNMPVKPKIFIQMSAIGYYGWGGDNLLDENSPAGKGFLAELTQQWEAAASEINKLGVKLMIARTGLVVGKGGGLLSKITPPFRFYLGGHFGKGDQWMSWIHLDDVVNAIQFLLKSKPSYTVYNLTSPQAEKARDFFRALGRELHRPSWLHLPEFLLKVALGEMAKETILISQKVYPAHLIKAGFEFRYPELTQALASLVNSQGSIKTLTD